jgi:hypothetical protein
MGIFHPAVYMRAGLACDRQTIIALMRAVLFLGGVLVLAAVALPQGRRNQLIYDTPDVGPDAEFHFLRMEYTDMAGGRGRGFGRGYGRGWWMQDYPRAELHFNEGVRRLTRLDVGEGRHASLTDDRIFEYPWIYATQVGYWMLSDTETTRLREYIDRGGFLVVDDFWGEAEWEVFVEAMNRAFPGWPILEIKSTEPMMHVLYDIEECVQIPGLRHLRVGPGGAIIAPLAGTPPHWRAIYDEKGRMVVAINYNMDIGDAWEEADVPEYPIDATTLAYRFAINSIVYAMTH